MIKKIEVCKKIKDAYEDILLNDIKQEGFEVKKVKITKVYYLKGKLSPKELKKVIHILVDPLVEEVCSERKNRKSIEIRYNPGVTDPEAEWLKKSLLESGIKIMDINISHKYTFKGRVGKDEMMKIAREFLYNPLIQHIASEDEEVFPSHPKYKFKLIKTDIFSYPPSQLLRISEEKGWYLSLDELERIKKYFEKVKRVPTDVEMETIAQTWSEHCKHKTFRGIIILGNKKVRIFDDMIKNVTESLKLPWCLSVFSDNSGVVEFDEEYGITFKVETHNHPSAIEPYGGAATGVGGVIRDCLGTGVGAKPILNTDVFCFAMPDISLKEIPADILHPKRILKGVVRGVRDYGNRMGIPTASGAIFFNNHFLYNPLVFVGTVGLIKKRNIKKEVKEGQKIYLVGAKTGRDGIHGATFSSAPLKDKTRTKYGSAVQIGNPIEEKVLRDFILLAAEKNLIEAITDCGGGGLSSAIGEMTANTGARVHLDKVPLKYTGLSYTEIWISESQERMVIFTTKGEKLKKLAQEIGIECTEIGEVTGNKKLLLFYKDHKVGELDMEFLHHGIPYPKKTAYIKPRVKEEELPRIPDQRDALIWILSHPTVASKEWVIKQYDHEVGGRTFLKPLSKNDAPMDAVVLKPLYYSDKGIAVSEGLNPLYGLYDPYRMGCAVVDEVVRNLLCVGGVLERIALLDNFCAGDAQDPYILGELTKTAEGLKDTALFYRIPFISGKDSLNNFFVLQNKKINIPTTILVSGVTIIPDVSNVISSNLKREGNLIYIIGETAEETGGSMIALYKNKYGKNVPKVLHQAFIRNYKKLENAIRKGLVSSLHDISEGGIGVAICEMCIGGKRGVELNLSNIPLRSNVRDDLLLFSESQGRIIAEVSEENKKDFEEEMQGASFALIGKVRKDNLIIFENKNFSFTIKVEEVEKAWKNGLTKRIK